MLLRLSALALTSHPPEAPVESLALVTEGCRVRSDQLDLFRPRGPDLAAVDRFDVEVSDGSVPASASAEDSSVIGGAAFTAPWGSHKLLPK